MLTEDGGLDPVVGGDLGDPSGEVDVLLRHPLEDVLGGRSRSRLARIVLLSRDCTDTRDLASVVDVNLFELLGIGPHLVATGLRP